jgi:DNA-directed RNA polymerase subunit RPC12/RpoP
MTDNVSTDRKACPHCGHMNRAGAKVCTQCGRPFVLSSRTGMLRKTCPFCGHENRLRARVCSQCGKAFSGTHPIKTSIIGGRQKWCPQCGAARRPGAKVCTQCGHRFSFTRLTAPIVQPTPPAVTLPPDSTTPAVKLPTDISGEPAPYLSSDELDRLRGGGAYHPNVFIRLLSTVNKKST